MNNYNWCIPMTRTKMRKILARELYGYGVGDVYMKLHQLGIEASKTVLIDNSMVTVYLSEYYPNPRYPAYIEANDEWLTTK